MEKTIRRHYSEERNRKISLARKGMVFTKEHIENMSKVRLGKKRKKTGKSTITIPIMGSVRRD